MKNAQKKGLMALAALAVLPVIFLSNCKVGLGSAVDTKAPAVAITYPSTDSVIRGKFVMSGTAEDETGIASVKVVLTKLPAALGIKSEEITGSMDTQNGKTWTASINTPDAATGAYSIADGKYEALVTVTDTVGRKSSTTVIYTIDNTRPIVAVSQPATRGTQNPWEFGSELNFTGLQYDENISGVFTIDFFNSDGAKISTYKGANVLTDWALDVKEDSAAFQALKKAMADVNIPQKFWYAITVEDLAYEFTNPAEASDTVKTGNSSTYYYSWTDISSLLVAGDFAPKINALYNMDSGLSVSSSEMPSSITLNKLKEIRIALGLPADQVTSQYGAFTIDPSNRQPVISTDGILPGDNRSNENQIGKGETIRFEIKKNKDNTPILVNEMKYRLDSYVGNTWLEGTTTPIALSEITQGTTIVYNYSAPVEVGTYRLVFDVKDLNKSNARNSTYEFIVNAGAPSFTIAPGASIYAPDGTFTAKITAVDDSRDLTLKVEQRNGENLDEVGAYQTTDISGSEENYTSVWTLTLRAAENGSDVTYRFEVSDGKWSNSKEQKFTTDNNSPVLLELNSPSMNVESGSGTEICYVSAPALTVIGKADTDIRQARVRVTTVDTAPDDDITNPEWKVVNVAADDSCKFTAALELPSDADGVREDRYYAWYLFADDTYQMGPVTPLFDIVFDKNDPNISYTINGNPESYYDDTIDGYNIVPADFTLSGSVWDAEAGSSAGIDSLTYTQSVFNVGTGLNEVAGTPDTLLTVNLDGTWTLPSISDDGKYTFVLTVEDWAGKTKESSVKVQKDTNPPNLAIMNPSEGQYIPSLITITGTVRDPGAGVADVQVSFDNGLNWKTSADGLTFNESNWSYTPIAADIGAEGDKTLHVWAIDKAGQEVYAKTDIASLTPAQEALYMRNFSYDSANPVLTITTPAGVEAYTNSASYTFAFNASDTQSIDSLTYTLNGGSAVTIFNTATVLPGGLASAAGTRNNLTVSSYPISGLVEGINDVVFTLTDKATKTHSKTVRIIRDTVPPVIAVTSVIPSIENGSTFDVNGIITVTGTFSDALDGLASVFEVTERAGNTDAFYSAATVTASGFTVSIDTRTVTEQDGEAGITLADIFEFDVRDKAGNSALTTNESAIMTELREYVIDQTTDTPVIDTAEASFDITAEASTDVTSSVNLFTNSQYLTALLSDDDGISRIDFYVDTDEDGFADGGAIGSIPSINRSVYNMNFKVGDLGLTADQTHRIQLRITDTKLGTTDATEAGDNGRYASPWFYIGIDTGAPSITIDNSVGGSVKTDGSGNEYVDLGFLTADKTVNGISKGSFSISSVILNSLSKLGTGDGITDGADVGDETWSFILEPADSVQEIFTVTASDNFGRNIIKRFSYIFDFDDPELSTLTAANQYFKKAEGASLSGTAQEAPAAAVTQSGLKVIEYAVLDGEDNTDISSAEWKTLTNASLASWTGTISDFAGKTDGWYTIHVRAVDKSNNESSTKYVSVYADSKLPVITTTKDGSSLAETSWYEKGTFDMEGTLAEDTYTDGSMHKWTYDRYYQANTALPYGAATNTNVDLISGTTYPDWSFTETSPADGKYKYVITARDQALYETVITREIFIDTTAPTLAVTNLSSGNIVSSNEYTYRGTLNDSPAGPKTVYYQFTQTSGLPAFGTDPEAAGYTAVSAHTTSWAITKENVAGTTPAGDDLCEGQWYLHLVADDTAGNLTAGTTIPFIVDLSNPEADETVIKSASTVDRTGLFNMTVTAEDTNALKNLTIVQKRNGTGAVTIRNVAYTTEQNESILLTDLPHTNILNTPVAVDGSADGLYTYDITVTDFANKTHTITRSVRFDTQAPSISVTKPVADEWYSDGSFSPSGILSDTGSGAVNVYYAITGTIDKPAAGAYTSLAASNAWTFTKTVDTGLTTATPGNLYEGVWYLHLRAEDQVGNITATTDAQTVKFYLDRDNPSVTETVDGTKGVGTGTAVPKTALFSLNLAAGDTHALKSLTVKQKKNGVDELTVYEETALNGISYPYVLSGLPFTSVGPNVSADIDGSDDGVYTYDITVTDIAGKTSSITRSVRFDTKAPVVTNISPAANAWIDSTTLNLSGNATDDSGVSEVRYNLQPGSPSSAPASPATWTAFESPTNLSASISGAGEGVNTLWLYTVDIHGNNAVTNHVFKVDTLVPSLSITGDSIRYIRTTDTNISLSGEASDTAELDKVVITVNSYTKTINAPLTADKWTAAEIAKDQFTENIENIVKITAYDKSGRTTQEKVTVYRDTQAPVTTVTTVNQLLDFGGHANAVNGTVTISGTLSDNTGIAGYKYTLSRSGYTAKVFNVPGAASNFTISLNTLDPAITDFTGDLAADDNFVLTVLVESYDASGNVSNTGTDPASSAAFTLYVDQDSDNPIIDLDTFADPVGGRYVFTTAEQIGATISDDDGIASTVRTIDSGSLIAASSVPAVGSRSGRFVQKLTGLTEGEYTITLTVTDNMIGRDTTVDIPIVIDNNNPDVSFNLTQNEYRGDFILDVIATDTNGDVTLTHTNPAGVSIIDGTPDGDAVPYTISTTDAGLTSVTISFTAEDEYGRTTTRDFKYEVDLGDPTLTIETVIPSLVYIDLSSNPLFQIAGELSDTRSGPKDVRYALLSGSGTPAPAIDSLEWLSAAGISDWNAAIDMSGREAGDYTAYICARDYADNYTVSDPVNIKADQDAPLLDNFAVSTKTFFNSDFTITGDASDPEGNLDRVTAHYTGLGTVEELGSTGSWTYTVPVSQMSGSVYVMDEGNYTLTITAYDKSGKTFVYNKPFTVDRKAPEISYNGIKETSDPDEYTNFIDSDPKVYVNLTDDNGISTAVVQFRKESGDTPVAQIEIPGFVRNRKSYSFALAMKEILGDGNLTDGVWRAEIVSTDVTDNTSNTVTSSYFRVDRNNPTVSVPKIFTGGTEVTNGFVTSGVNYTVSGTMSDGDGGIKSVEVQLKHDNTIIPINSHDREPADISTPGVWTVDIGDVFALTGSYDLVVIATDNAGRTKEEKLVLQCDITKPEIVFISPFAKDATQPATMIGEITLSGKSIDSAMSKNWYAVGGDLDEATGIVTQKSSGPVIDWLELVDKPYNWDTTINTSAAATASFAVQVGGGTSTIWDLPVHIKAMDVSGNIAYDTLVIRIDTDKDKPVVEIQSPNNGETVGGQFSITGSANDDNFIHSVYMQVEVVGASYSSNVLTNFTGSEVLEGVDANGDSQTHYFTRIGNDPSAWYKISGYDKYAWVFTLNKLKEFNKEVLQGNGVPFTQAELDRENSSTTTKLIIRVKAYDTKTQGTSSGSIFGYYDEIELTLQSGAPSILIDDMPVHNEYISGTVNTDFTVVDDEGIESVNISIGGVPKIISYGDVTDSPTVINGYTVKGSDPNTIGATTYFKTWTVTNEWDTTSITAPSVALTIEATDYSATSPKTTMNNRTALIDNTAPVFNYHTDNTIIKGDVDRAHTTDSIAMLGNTAGIYGNTRDDGSRINKVILYFTKTVGGVTSIYTMGGTGIDTGSVLTSTITINGTAHPFPVANISLIETGRTGGGEPQKYIVIDKAEGGRDSSEVGDNDGYNEQMYPSGEWYVKPDSLKLNDGVYDLHCVVVDNAGNIAYAADKILVQNNKPTITSIDLYTDINMSGAIDAADASTNILIAELAKAADFDVRNNQFQVKINASADNGGMTYTLTQPTGNTLTQPTPGHFTLGNLGTNGVKNFSMYVSDSLGLKSAVYSFTVMYENTDEKDPETELFELNTDIASGINLNTGSISLDGGHIETRLMSDYNNGTTDAEKDPDVSGTIILRGKASDNQRLTNVTLTIGSETVTVLTWDGSAMGPAANVVSETLGVEGHVVEWAYVWDTSTVQDSSGIVHALLNTEVSVHAADASDRNSQQVLAYASGYNDMTVDVMPYITKVTTGLSLIKKNNPSIFNRTALGHYPVSSAEDITIVGYNLDSVEVNAKEYAANNGEFTIPAADVTNLTTGNLVLTVNSVPLLNNENDNAVETNQTPNGENNPLLTDDVYLDIWNIDSDAVKSVRGAIKEPVMKVNPATGADGRVGFAFANGVDTFSMANGTTNSYTRWQQNYADYGEVAFGFDFQGRSHGIVIGHDTEPNAGYAGRMNYVTSTWNVPLTDARDNFRFYRKLRIESCGLPVGSQLNGTNVATRIIDTTRFQSPSLAVASSAARTEPTVYLAYYDNLQEQIRFRWGTNNVATRNTVTRAQTGFNQFYDVDTAAGRNSTANDTYVDHIIFEPDPQYYSLIAGDENNATGNTGNVAGQYVAIDVIPGANANEDIVAIIWYDGADLWYIYRANTKNDVNASKAAAVMDGTNVLWSKPVKIFTGAGIDCAIAVDDAATPGIHIAGYDRINGALRYAYLSSYDDTTPDTCVVDDYDIVGTKISITTVIKDYDHDNDPDTAVKNGVVPYISYYMASTQRPKLAYLVDPSSYTLNTHGSDESTAFTGAWEITLIPTTSIVNEDRINVDFWRNTDGKIKNSTYTANTETNQTGYVYGNGTANPILGYAVTVVTDGQIETAQMK